MSAPADPNVNGKAPAQPTGSQHPHRQGQLVNVQPARLGDLQPKYAQQIDHDGDDTAAHGWYGSFSKCLSERRFSYIHFNRLVVISA